ncbi:MAG: carbohydrate ABC transporter substrate-binding protein [Lachnospiraceae bacterium]|nr:carbohydrate ABC transporter substrate-binding protein [Lachnospiraceae bacterium]
MKKLNSLLPVLAAVVALGSAGTCTASADEGKVINIYSWNNEFQQRVEAVYDKVDHTSDDGTVTYLTDGCEIHWIISPNTDGVYQRKLDEALINQGNASGDSLVDIFLSEIDYVVKYTDADVDIAIPLTDLGIDPETDLADQYGYTKVIASDVNGVQRGTTWQSCPCLLVYRRDIAKDTFGTDDPDEIASVCGDWTKMKEAAEKLKDKGYFTFASCADTFRSYSNNISAPWVSFNGPEAVLTVDPCIMDWISDSKEWLDAGYLNKTVKGIWTDDWNKAMGSKSSVFAFMFPAWGIDFVLTPNWDGEAGAWGVTTGPQAFNWGGSFIHGCAGTDNPEHVREIMLALTGSAENMEKITREYTEFTNNTTVMNAIAEDGSFGTEFLGGENPFKYFAPAAQSIEMVALSPYDQGCAELIQSSFSDYFQGQIDFDRAKANFETAIKERYPDITQVIWP